jgi:hypothetical protein
MWVRGGGPVGLSPAGHAHLLPLGSGDPGAEGFLAHGPRSKLTCPDEGKNGGRLRAGRRSNPSAEEPKRKGT